MTQPMPGRTLFTFAAYRRAALALLAGTLLLGTTPARAELPPAMLAHLEIAGPGRTTDHAIFVYPDGEPGKVQVSGSDRSETEVMVRLQARPVPVITFDVRRRGDDKTGFWARGETALPAAGHKLVVAHVPQAGGDLEIRLSLTPARQ